MIGKSVIFLYRKSLRIYRISYKIDITLKDYAVLKNIADICINN